MLVLVVKFIDFKYNFHVGRMCVWGQLSILEHMEILLGILQNFWYIKYDIFVIILKFQVQICHTQWHVSYFVHKLPVKISYCLLSSETHFLFKCDKLEEIRRKYYHKVPELLNYPNDVDKLM